ncbi:substrate-binding domain-containing protein [Nocardioides albus]|uniref:DNA-binding LacI/PurR family transcriptional regulator n=1 Tax=Nocardioides albus TaxID=1841 RepID=A0A7W5FA06_9ACTN|nr:substrate-binding domain-containing protein [Nocardioides albus]MBB3090626.1 DNA-binding LacI/PurR family transcriptional regulator [Nocardioides albus]
MTEGQVTIVDVAATAGVSLSTASKALNGRDRVSQSTRDRVVRVAQELGYRPNVRAQRMRTGRSSVVALVTALPAQIVSEAAHLGFLLELSFPIAEQCLRNGYSMLLVPPVSDLAALDQLDIDGAIVVDPRADDPIADRFRSRGVTVVTVGKDGAGAADAYLDRGAGGADVMLDHLADAGARHVAVALSRQPYSLADSHLAYLESRSDEHLRVSVIRADASAGEEGGYVAVREALVSDPSIDAVYAPLDALAAGGLRAAVDLGRTVPDDLMVATNYDGRRAALAQPAITALDLNLPVIGTRVADLLLGLLNGRQVAVAHSPTPVVIARASTSR